MGSLTLPLNLVITINILLIGMMLVLAFVGYLRGFISQIYNWVFIGLGISIGLLVSPSLAATILLLPTSFNFDQVPFIGITLIGFLNRFLWIIIIATILFIVGLIFKKFIIKKIFHYDKKVLLDRIGGAVFAVIPVVLTCFIIAFVLSLPLFTNGSEIISNSVLSPFGSVSTTLVENVVIENPVIDLYTKISDGEPLGESEFEVIEATLQKMDFPQNVVEVAMKFVRQEEVTDEDLNVMKKYAEQENITEETFRGWMKELGFTDEQINALMANY